MTKMTILRLSAIAVMTVFISSAYATDYKVTVTNLTSHQPMSPILAITHTSEVKAFDLGTPVIKEVAAIAQDGNTALLKTLAQSAPGVLGAIFDSGTPTPPGKSTSFTITTTVDKNFITLLSMLVNTNDAFIGLNAVPLPIDSTPTMSWVPAIDAGVEDNDEDCNYIPGPACNSPNKASALAGEGFAYISSGIHSIASLPAKTYDWRNPAARIVIVKLN